MEHLRPKTSQIFKWMFVYLGIFVILAATILTFFYYGYQWWLGKEPVAAAKTTPTKIEKPEKKQKSGRW